MDDNIASWILNPYLASSCFLFYLIGLAIYRLYFHPLARFPGPKLAALSQWYEFYYDVILKGRYIFKIKELHEKYGPIVRVTPFEVHINDPDFYDVVFSHSGRREKYWWTNIRLGIPDSFFSTTNHELHRMRRSPLNSMFSKRQIVNFEPYIQVKVDTLFRIFKRHAENDQVLRLDHAFSAFTGDIISEFAFAQSFNALESEDFKDNLHEAFQAACSSSHATLQFQWLLPMMNSLPPWLVVKLEPRLQQLINLQMTLAKQVEDIRHGRNEAYKVAKHPTLFRELLDSNLPAREKAPLRIKQEAQNLVGAGLETVAWTLSCACYYIVSQPEVEEKLRTELGSAITDPNNIPLWGELEKLPYLKGCIWEALRLSYGVTARLNRVAPDEVLQYKQWTIPTGTPVSQTITLINHNEDLFPDSHSFRPERWIEAGGKLDKYMFSFSKGSRMCLGLNLAQAELFKCMALLFRRLKFELYETDVTDVQVKHDFFLPAPRLDSKGVRVKIVGVE